LESFKATNPTTKTHNKSAHALILTSDVPVTRSILDIAASVTDDKYNDNVVDDATAPGIVHKGKKQVFVMSEATIWTKKRKNTKTHDKKNEKRFSEKRTSRTLSFSFSFSFARRRRDVERRGRDDDGKKREGARRR